MSNLKNVDINGRSGQTPPSEKKQKKDRAVLIYHEQHRLLKEEAFKTEKEMREIASEAIDYYFKNRNK